MDKLKGAGLATALLVFAVLPIILYGMLLRLGYSLMGAILGIVKGLIASPEFLVLLLALAAIIWVQVAFARAQYKLLAMCSEKSRAMTPGKVWFTLIPYIGQIAGVFIVHAIARSAEAELADRNGVDQPKIAAFPGYIYFATSLLSFVPAAKDYGFPLLGFYVVSLTIYWRSVVKCRKALAVSVETLVPSAAR